MYFSLRDEIDGAILGYAYSLDKLPDWEYGDDYLLALHIHMAFYELGIYDIDNR